MHNPQKMTIDNVSKIVFLDIDGCVTSRKDGSYFNPDPTKYHPSKKIVEKLVRFCKVNDAMIVVSSNWRKFSIDGYWSNSYGTYKNPMQELVKMISDVYLGTLPADRHATKPTALAKWLSLTGYDKKFVVFDDDLSEGYSQMHEYGIDEAFVHVDSMFGITDDDLNAAIKILER